MSAGEKDPKDAVEERWAVIVTGGLGYGTEAREVAVMHTRLAALPKGTVVVHGQARGADELADELARDLRLPPVRVPYIGWLRGAGGPVRNRLMATVLAGLRGQGYRTKVLAFGGDAGTENMVKVAEEFGFEVEWSERPRLDQSAAAS